MFGSDNRLIPADGSFWVFYGSIERLAFHSAGHIPTEVGEMGCETDPILRQALKPLETSTKRPPPYYMIPSSQKEPIYRLAKALGL